MVNSSASSFYPGRRSGSTSLLLLVAASMLVYVAAFASPVQVRRAGQQTQNLNNLNETITNGNQSRVEGEARRCPFSCAYGSA